MIHLQVAHTWRWGGLWLSKLSIFVPCLLRCIYQRPSCMLLLVQACVPRIAEHSCNMQYCICFGCCAPLFVQNSDKSVKAVKCVLATISLQTPLCICQQLTAYFWHRSWRNEVLVYICWKDGRLSNYPPNCMNSNYLPSRMKPTWYQAVNEWSIVATAYHSTSVVDADYFENCDCPVWFVFLTQIVRQNWRYHEQAGASATALGKSWRYHKQT